LREKAIEEALHGGRMLNGIERVGQAWTGGMADALAAGRLAEKDKEDYTSPVEKDRQGRIREFGKKVVKLPQVSNPSSEAYSHHQLPIPTGSKPLAHTSPLTPPNSEKSISTMLSSVSGSTESVSSHENDHDSRKRSPPEPILRANGAPKGRPRSVTASANKDSNPTRTVHSRTGASTANATVGTGHKPGRGRGRGGTGASRKSSTRDGGGGPTTHSTGRGRGSRGARPPGSTPSGPRRPSTH
jgi:hypothetical protein